MTSLFQERFKQSFDERPKIRQYIEDDGWVAGEVVIDINASKSIKMKYACNPKCPQEEYDFHLKIIEKLHIRDGNLNENKETWKN
jgi:hypothetical protein